MELAGCIYPTSVNDSPLSGTSLVLGRSVRRMRKDRLVTEGFQNLGQRLVQAARLAVAVHLYESVVERTSHGGDTLRIASQVLRRRVEIGGAGPREAGDDVPQPGDLVTDDERDGLIGRSADSRETPER